MFRRFVNFGFVAAFGVVSLGAEGCAFLANVKEPAYAVVDSDGEFEVREYAPRVVAETEVSGTWNEAGNAGFRRLADYIFGKNKGRTKIAMTAPVAQRSRGDEGARIAMTAPVGQRHNGDTWTVSFTMPDGETLATLPVPDDNRVILRNVPAQRVAVARFSGRWTDANIAEHTESLRAWARARGVGIFGEPEVNRYDPPFRPWFMRRNEVWFAVDNRETTESP